VDGNIPDESADRWDEAYSVVLRTRPTTPAGLAALAAWARERADWLRANYSHLDGEGFLAVLASPFKSLRLEAENAVLRHQLIVVRRRLPGRVRLTNHDRWFFIQLYRWFPSILQVLTIIRPETLVRWHRAAFAVAGVGSRAPKEGDRRSTRSCAY
jgi:hypothetical protein